MHWTFTERESRVHTQTRGLVDALAKDPFVSPTIEAIDVTVICPTAPTYTNPDAASQCAHHATSKAERAKCDHHGPACAALGYTAIPLSQPPSRRLGLSWVCSGL